MLGPALPLETEVVRETDECHTPCLGVYCQSICILPLSVHWNREDINQCGLAVLEHELDSDVENVFPGGQEVNLWLGGGDQSHSVA